MPDAPPVTTATRLIGAHRASTGVELEVQLGEAAEDPGRLVVEAAVAGRAVVLLGEADVVHAVEDALEADAALGAGERAAGARVVAAPERDVRLRVRAVDAELGRALEAPGVAVGGAVEQHHRRARRDVDAADRRGAAGEAEVGLHRALDAQHLLEEVRDALAVGAQLVLELRVLGEVLQRGGEQARGRLLAGGEQERRGAHDVDDLGRGAVGVGREREVGEHVVARLAPAVLDVLRRTGRRATPSALWSMSPCSPAPTSPGVAAQAEALAEPLVVVFGHAEQVGDHEHGERLRVRADELAAAVGDELVELLVGEAPHELLVVLEPLRRDQPHQQRALLRVRRAGPS